MGRRGDGEVDIATAAGRYHPLFYAVVGFPSRPFDGASIDYVMRSVSALLCGLGVALAAFALATTWQGRGTRLAFIASLSPVFVYSTVLPAPNAPEIVAALWVWVGLLSLGSSPTSRRTQTGLVVMAALGAAALGTMRTLGPLWLVLIVAAVVVYVGMKPFWQLVSTRPMLCTFAAVVAGLGVAHGLWWAQSGGLAAGSYDVDASTSSAHVELGANPYVWVLQLIAAFPRRADSAPPIVYATYGLLIGGLIWLAVRSAARRATMVLIGALLVVLVLPILVSLATADTHGLIWQGRYTLPFAAGLVILCGVSIDRARKSVRHASLHGAIAWTLLTVAHVVSVVTVARNEHLRPVSASDSSWVTISPWLIGATMVLGMLAWLRSMSDSAQVKSSDPRILATTQQPKM